LIVALVAYSIPINFEDDPKNDGIKIEEISGKYAAVSAVAIGGLAAVIVILHNRADEINALKEEAAA